MEIISKAMSLRLLFSSLLLTCCMMAVSAQSTQPNDEIWYTSTDSKPVEPFNKFAFGATLNSNTYNNGKVIITFDGDLDSIGVNAFLECTSLTSIRLPETITSIKDTAFANCKNLKNVVLPDFLTSIGNWAFYGCEGLDSINIPDSVKSIGESAFSLCTSLNSIKIPDSVTSIERSAFSYCSGLKSVVLSNLLAKIEDLAFFNCSSLESIKIPESVTKIENMAFNCCTKLTSVHVRWTNRSSIVNLDDGIIYDLQGRQVTDIQSGKIYIMDGKKYIAK